MTDDTTDTTATPETTFDPASQEAPTANETAETGADGQQAAQESQDRQKARDDRFRERARAAEARAEALEARMQAIQRRDAESMARSTLQDPSDLWSSSDLSDLLGEDGELDPQAVKAAADRIVAAKPHWKRRERVSDAGNLSTGEGPRSAPDWGTIFRASMRRGGR